MQWRTIALALWPVLLAAQRREALDVLLKVLSPSNTRITGRITAVDKSWEDWQKRTGELPPDFDAMPSIPGLPDPLQGVKTPAQWEQKRKWIRAQFERWVTGRMPPKPDNLRAAVTATRDEGGVTVRDVRLEFGPGRKATLRVQLMIPPGTGPFPVLMTNHPRTRPWVATAVRRGYIGCIYFATDPKYEHGDDSDAYIEIYPEYDFSCLARWAWAGMRAVDYLHTLPEVDKARIAVTGHSRNGKQALIAAAFDERIGAVIPSSGNTGECDPWRYTSDMFANETIEQITGGFPHWFHPRLRFFAGREDKLPVDQNMLMALVAPRGLLMYSAFSETQGNAFGFEQGYRSVKRVYTFLGHPEKVGLHLRAGEHPTTAGDIENFVDFLDTVFGRKSHPRFETYIHGYTFAGWKAVSQEPAARPPGRGAPVSQRQRWALGDEPAGVRFPARTGLKDSGGMTSEGWLGVLLSRPVKIPGAASAGIGFGDDLRGELYYPESASGKMPVIVWLHAFSYPTGYSRYARTQFAPFLKRGYAVMAFDQIGFGTRAGHARRFHERYPHWSLLGKMVADTRAAVDALAALQEIDSSRIYLAGYALGGKVGLWTAALEPRVKGVISIAGFTPLRAAAGKPIEGVRMYSHLHGLVPRFGFYAGNEKNLPVDYDEILGAIAPRPVLVIAPTLDRYAPVQDVRAAVARAGSHVRIETPVDFNRLPASTLQIAAGWLE
ncbi:MAG: alpha/beta fold hydrolase [Bryobacteraceae bacterium]